MDVLVTAQLSSGAPVRAHRLRFSGSQLRPVLRAEGRGAQGRELQLQTPVGEAREGGARFPFPEESSSELSWPSVCGMNRLTDAEDHSQLPKWSKGERDP